MIPIIVHRAVYSTVTNSFSEIGHEFNHISEVSAKSLFILSTITFGVKYICKVYDTASRTRFIRPLNIYAAQYRLLEKAKQN